MQDSIPPFSLFFDHLSCVITVNITGGDKFQIKRVNKVSVYIASSAFVLPMCAKMLFRLFVAQVLLIVCSATSDIRYVRPADSPLSSCPGQPCLTLHEYVEIDNFTNGATLQFLPGNHTLQQSFSLVNISNVTFEAAFNHSVTNIICKDNATIHSSRVTHLHIVGLSFLPSQRGNISALKFRHSKSVFISDTVFQGSGEMITGRAIRFIDSEATISRCMFKGLTVTDSLGGGAILCSNTNLTIHGSSFINNKGFSGGAIYAICSSLLLNKTIYHGNSAQRRVVDIIYEDPDTYVIYDKGKGGAISCMYSQVKIVGTSSFHNNSCPGDGAAISVKHSQLNIMYGIVCFHLNEARHGGGAVYVEGGKVTLGGNVGFHFNKARDEGGAVYVQGGKVTLGGNVTIESNTAKTGGGIRAVKSHIHVVGQCNLARNNATSGGAMHVKHGNITLGGNVTIESNTGKIGGGIRAFDSLIHIVGHCDLAWNNATSGGAMSTLYGTVYIQGPTQFTHNTADEDGGAMLADNTVIQIRNKVNFTFNSAINGGAMFFENGASMNLTYLNPTIRGPLLTSSFNTACQDGGVIYHRDSPSDSQCLYSGWNLYDSYTILPNCFLQFHQNNDHDPVIISKNDSAVREGSFLFGGWLDSCKVENGHYFPCNYVINSAVSISQPTTRIKISSQPYSLCLMTILNTEDMYYLCSSEVLQVKVYRGQKFRVPLQAKNQNGPSAAIVTAITSSTARLETYQTSQPLALPAVDTDYDRVFLSYTVYSNESHEKVVLYPDGPCRDTGRARVVINVTLLPCPDGFTQSGEICTCEDRLHDYPVNCSIADTPYFTKTAGFNFWLEGMYVNTTYQGLVLCKSCPAEYCKKGAVKGTIDNPDMQCDLNRTGLLCGACAANHSLMLGRSKCQVCPNTYIALLLPFAAAGVALVVFLTSLRLTVATGTLNSVILYANILQVKRSLFFPQNTINLLTVSLAWMNLDLGFQTCFYDGLDAYALTWLQFAFPLYVWLIIGSMIFISRYSITVSKLIGSNPVAVLATLLLMSYTKILKIIIEVYSYENLDYPNNKTVPVWLKDANVPYLESKHLFLTVVTSLVLVFLFLPYTLLLLLGHKLYCFTGKKHWRWLNRLKPLLDSYYAPYKNHTRYWTGFLLLVRCALYIVFSISGASISLVTITLTFSVIGFIYIVSYFYAWRIYQNTLVNLIEACVYLNLVVLSVTALTGLNTAALVYSLVGLVFVVMITLIAHQFHLLYIAKTALWLRLKNKWPRFRREQSEVQISDDAINTSHDPHKIVTKTVIELREPLLDS